jgi:EAL and modified HD-GYP domain-containing signal transduction protein
LIENTESADQLRVTAPECFLGRQPIYDARREIRAYELLYRRNALDGGAHFFNGDQASADVLLKAFFEIGLSKVSPEHPVFINHTTGLLALNPIVPPDRCVIEVLEDVPVNSETIGCLQRLKDLGYQIALDDFVYSDARLPFLRLADYVKLDLRGLSPAEFRSHVKLMKGFPLKIIAEKIESEEEFQTSQALGCDLFQGYYLRKPEVVRGRPIPSNRLSALSLLAECMNPDQSAGAVAAIIARDAALIYGLLRLANSALYGRHGTIQSPVQAISMVGMDRVLRWASLLVLSGYDNCPIGYLAFALQRARSCEIVAQAYGCQPQLAYMTGLLSTLDSILNAPLADIIRPLPLDGQFKRAILHREGDLGSVLEAVLDYEAGHFDNATHHGISINRVQTAFWEAVEYSASMITDLKVLTANSAR